jgi:hypothetical protein
MTKLLTFAVDVVVTNGIIVHTMNAMERHADASKWLSRDIHKPCILAHSHTRTEVMLVVVFAH